MPDLSIVCTICKVDESKSWWKCCPKHTTQKGVDVVCENCANRCMSGKETIIHTDSKQDFAEGIADYIETHSRYSELTKRDVAVATARCLTEDIGAAQRFCDVIGLKIDLYDEDLYKE